MFIGYSTIFEVLWLKINKSKCTKNYVKLWTNYKMVNEVTKDFQEIK